MDLLSSTVINQDACIKFLAKYSKSGDGRMVDSMLDFEKKSNDSIENFSRWFLSVINYHVTFGETTYYVTKYEEDGQFWILEPGWFTITLRHWMQVYQFVVNVSKGRI